MDDTGGADDCGREVRSNLDWLAEANPPTRDCLDIGCCDGAALRGMRARGWSAWGFDVLPEAAGPDVVIAPWFFAGLFPRQFGAVLCREVIEHVDGWRQLLAEMWLALLPGGLLQVQTPVPGTPHPHIYAPGHLQLFSARALGQELERAGFAPVGHRSWGAPQPGQGWLGQRHQ